ncbi:CHASE2 domain-containing protein [Campylobacter canadensis]|uniref:Adenylate/guanylate cyclase domain-containing protein n=1 Tax=Campylobacter canadensis TaxID=449520 RepID=A0ABS7WQ06_9BACT|nr:adenylate/guanylate cyclase domain-containing protein [Campylobacter canadensis]MBZ7986853.1 adenylate/guanylate cyclase domain-containing protein [Campylobacter canadensis]MBZ7994174.1 adenylate/guanylate cyclase domain-containing protein [Campylobacter canadensis]MBZ7995833.1 adenylate/guanylate cyclase domain-containing protein [Campylobacter canadensis]MBZ7997890.1 adenylate/guanylate cyclase domain-containing protein [Campylobacter canadensis]MBZ7999506.1 adenylate/guanylate cyclase do
MLSKKTKLFIILAIFLTILAFILSVKELPVFTRLDNILHDMFFSNSIKKTKGDDKIVIIDIDEKSLKALGQWPWDRDVLACLNDKLKEAKVIGYDIYFAEPDNRGEISIFMSDKQFNNLNIKKLKNCKRYKNPDLAFANSLSKTPSILAYALSLGNYKNDDVKAQSPVTNQNISTENIDISLLEKGKNITGNIDILSENSYASGFVNSYSYLDSVIRQAFMLIYYDDGAFKELLPSLSLAMYAKYLNTDDISVYKDEFSYINIKVNNEIIPLNEQALMGIYFSGKSPNYKYISAIDVIDENIDLSFFKDKLVLIGTSTIGLNDIRSNPLDENLPGVEIHANVLDNMINKTFLKPLHYAYEINFLQMLICIVLSLVFMSFKNIFSQVLLIMTLICTILFLHYYLLIYEHILLTTFDVLFIILLCYFSATTINFFLENKQKEFIKSKLERKVSKNVAEALINTDANVFSTSKKEISIFFSDIRNFTSISEQMQTEELINLLNLYMTKMSDIILQNDGTIDKYIGDAIMAYFNAPNSIDYHADAALSSAILQIKALDKLNKELINKPYINIGIGINTGICIVGEMGSLQRSDYTCIGDSVNIASRIESMCKNYKANILISEETKNALKDSLKYELVFVDEIKLKGKQNSTKLYKCLGFKGENLNLYKD